MGVDFPIVTLPDGRQDRASATFLPQSNMLIVRKLRTIWIFVDALVDEANRSRPKQVEIEKNRSFCRESTRNNLKNSGSTGYWGRLA